MAEIRAEQYNGSSLAYLGDAVIELLVRDMLLRTGISNTGTLNAMSRAFVKATSQSDGVERILPLLSGEEMAMYKRGRNTHSASHPKSACVSQYRRASGFEALMGYLHLLGRAERISELFAAAYSDEIAGVSFALGGGGK